MADLLKWDLNTKAEHPTMCVCGVKPSGEPNVMQMSKAPHALCCGMTGSGKSVYVNQMLITMWYHATPNEVLMSAIDPKKVEFLPYKGVPYCPIDPVTDMNDAYGLAQFFNWEMKRRNKLMSAAGVKNIDELNVWFETHEEEANAIGMHEKLQWWFLVVDEYANMNDEVPEVESTIKQIGAVGRAAGIHLIIATQRPTADTISSTLKSNLPFRIALRVNDSINSDVILDHAGAEKLQGYGDCIIKDSGGEETHNQGIFFDTPELMAILEHLKKTRAKPVTILDRLPDVYPDICSTRFMANYADFNKLIKVAPKECASCIDWPRLSQEASRDKALNYTLTKYTGDNNQLDVGKLLFAETELLSGYFLRSQFLGVEEVAAPEADKTNAYGQSVDDTHVYPHVNDSEGTVEQCIRRSKEALLQLQEVWNSTSEADGAKREELKAAIIKEQRSLKQNERLKIAAECATITYMDVITNPLLCAKVDMGQPPCTWAEGVTYITPSVDKHVVQAKRARGRF